jgi:hypothetical protein
MSAMNKPKAPWQLTAGMILIAIAMVVISLIEEQRDRQAVERAAIEASYGEESKPEDHGI